MPVTVHIDTSEVQRVVSGFGRASKWVPQVTHTEMITLGKRVNAIMRDELKPRRYDGKLEDSVQDTYSRETATLEIGPTHKRGEWDAGLVAQFGTGPIKRLRWLPIKTWGERRGMTPERIGRAYMGIRHFGIKAHPFLNEVLQRSDFQNALEETANKLGQRLAAQSLVPSGAVGVATTA